MHLLCLCDLRLHHWIANWSHWLHLNLVPTYLWLCVLSKYFWVASWSLITLFTFEHSCQGLCGESTLPNDVLFLKCKLKRNHQDTITFKYNFNLLGTIVCTFPLLFFSTLVKIIFDSFMLTLFMRVEILFLNCFIITLVTFIFDHIMLGLCAVTKALLSLFITQVTFISYHVCAI